uniref:Replication timing regulatory factor 1 n=1 Tax=Salmo trutta TaxID=8032 RepID=A0A673ZZU9_SALTR
MVPSTSSGLLPLLESLEDSTAGQPEQTDAYLTIANRLSGDDGKQFLPAVVKHFPRLGKTFQTHISSQNAELSQAALQALGFCVFHVHVVSAISANFAEEILSALSSLVVKSTDKNTCTRALWVISKQNFPSEVVAKKVPEILRALECVQTREDIQSVVMEHESLNVVISLLEQASAQMGEDAVQWAKLVIPLVVHSASKVRLRAAAALEMGLPLLLEKQKEVAAIVEPLMSSKLIPELQKLFSTKNETNVLKLWPLFVRLLGKLLHRGGPFINSLLGLEELGFRSSSPNIKKIAFIAWKSLIDNFSLNPEILCSAKRLKLLMQPLSSIQVRTEALLLTKLEVWWYLVVKLGANLSAHFEQVGVPLLQCTLGPDSALPATPSRSSSQLIRPPAPPGSPAFSSSTVPRLNLNTSVVVAQAYPSIQLLGLEMLLHYFLGPEVTTAAAKNKLTLSLEPISHPFLSSPFSFTKHAPLLITAVRDSFICIGKDAPDALLALIWQNLVSFVSTMIDAGNKKERQGSEVLTLLLQALQSIISSEALPAHRALSLLELTVKGIPQRVLGSASYQVGKMDVLNGTPALFLVLLFYNHSLVAGFVEDERFFLCLETLVSCGLSGPTSPLAFGEAVLGAVGRSAGTLGNKEQLWRMWSLVVNPLTDTITQSNEVNQGDALEHNFSAVLTALMFPVTYLLPGKVLPQMTQKSMLGTWCRLYKVFARCSALVATAEENVCCEELCVKMAAVLDRKALKVSGRGPLHYTQHPMSHYKCVLSLQLEKLLSDVLGCLQIRSALAYDDELLALLSPLLCVLFLHRRKPVRSLATQFWNATFANTLVLVYPEELKPVLSQVKQNTPILLPGFQSVEVPDELSGQYSVSSESSQLETKLSGIQVTSGVKRDSLLPRAEEMKDRNSKTSTKLVSVSLPRREELEEQASIDFVFIPPETKERVLTEHQKEVKRTKRSDDVIPDTQSQVEVLKEVPVPAVEEVMGNNSQEEEESNGLLEDSTSSQSTPSQGEPRRSGRRRSRPLRPGEDAEERDDKDKRRKTSQPGEEVSQTDSPKTTPSPASPTDSQSQGRASRRSKLAVEEDGGKDKLRRRSHKEVSELSQSNSQVATPSPAGDSNRQTQGWRSNKLVREQKKRGVAKKELSQSDSITVTASDNDSQSQSRRSQRSKLAVEVEEDGNQKRKGSRAQKEKPSQTDSHVATPSQLESQSQGRTSRSKAISDSEEFDLLDKVEKQDPTEEEQSQSDSQMATLSPASQTGDTQSHGRSSRRSKLVTESEEQGKDKQKRRVGTENTLSQIDSKITTPSATSSATPKDSQSQGRASRKSKVPLEVAELEDKTSPNVATDSAAAPEMSQTDSQVTPSATRQTDSQPRPRGRFSKRSKLEEQVKKASSSPMPTPTIATESSQVADQAGTQESPQGSRRTTRQRASQGLLSSNVENSESDVSETWEDAQKPKKRGRNPKSTEGLPSPLATVGSGEPGAYQEIPMNSSESSLKSESEKSDMHNPLSEALEVKISQDVDETIKSINSFKPDMDVLKLPLITKNDMGQREANTEMVDIEGECENTKLPSQLIDSSLKPDLEQLKSQHLCISPRKNLKTVSSQEGVHSDFGCEGPTRLQNKLLTDSEQANSPVPSADGNSVLGYESVLLEPNKLSTPPISNGLPTDTSPSDAAEEKLSLSLQVAESSGEMLVDVPKPVTVSSEEVTEEQMGEDKENRHPESTNNVLEEDQPEEDVFMSIVHTQPEDFNALNEEQQEEQYTCIKAGQPESDNPSTRTKENDTEPQANDVQDITPLQERAKMDTVPGLECEEEDGEETQIDNNDLTLHPLDSVAPLNFDTSEAPVPLHHPSTSKDVLCQESPPKQKSLEAMMGLEVGQSPSSGRIRGMWTPSASPSTSILKKGQKRPIEEESPSPFTKSRRVSFADPIQHQELADDIDRRSPVIRSSSPRTKTTSITQPKISEMSQEPRPIPKDCVYPALVSCSTPVEAVLPQITSNMWPRGFGHLVRARNIKTVGDLSALTPSEIKNLPIRSPKISNVKTALKTYHEQQVMPRTFKTQGSEDRLDQSRPDHQRPEGDLLLEVESLGALLAGEELSRCSPDQLVQLHDQLGGMMKNVVVQLQSRLLSQNKDSGP